MQTHISTTPFGRRAVSLGQIASQATAKARKHAVAAARKFETALAALHDAVVELREAARALSKASNAQRGYGLHFQSVDIALGLRVQDVLDRSGVQFQPHRPSKVQPSIVERFE